MCIDRFASMGAPYLLEEGSGSADGVQAPLCRPVPRQRDTGGLRKMTVLSEIQTSNHDTERAFAQEKIRPHSARLEAEGGYPPELFRDMAGLGLFGMTAPEGYGGAEADGVSYALALIEIAAAGGRAAPSRPRCGGKFTLDRCQFPEQTAFGANATPATAKEDHVQCQKLL